MKDLLISNAAREGQPGTDWIVTDAWLRELIIRISQRPHSFGRGNQTIFDLMLAGF